MTENYYSSWGQSELIEKLVNSDSFAKEVANYFNNKPMLLEEEEYLLEKARKLSGLKVGISNK